MEDAVRVEASQARGVEEDRFRRAGSGRLEGEERVLPPEDELGFAGALLRDLAGGFGLVREDLVEGELLLRRLGEGRGRGGIELQGRGEEPGGRRGLGAGGGLPGGREPVEEERLRGAGQVEPGTRTIGEDARRGKLGEAASEVAWGRRVAGGSGLRGQEEGSPLEAALPGKEDRAGLGVGREPLVPLDAILPGGEARTEALAPLGPQDEEPQGPVAGPGLLGCPRGRRGGRRPRGRRGRSGAARGRGSPRSRGGSRSPTWAPSAARSWGTPRGRGSRPSPPEVRGGSKPRASSVEKRRPSISNVAFKRISDVAGA